MPGDAAAAFHRGAVLKALLAVAGTSPLAARLATYGCACACGHPEWTALVLLYRMVDAQEERVPPAAARASAVPLVVADSVLGTAPVAYLGARSGPRRAHVAAAHAAMRAQGALSRPENLTGSTSLSPPAPGARVGALGVRRGRSWCRPLGPYSRLCRI